MEPAARNTRPKPKGDTPNRLDPIARRIVYALALIPIVPAISAIGVALLDHFYGFGAYDGLRWFHFLVSALWVVATIAIWRGVILWTLGRKWLTALVNLIPFVQVVYGQPLWVAPKGGCSTFLFLRDEALRAGQHEIGIGIWIWLTIWVWWGWEKTVMNNDNVKLRSVRSRMTPTAKRLVASMASIPFLVGSLLVVGELLSDFARISDPFPEALALTALMAIAAWVLIWRRGVTWTQALLFRTAGLAMLCFGLPIGGQFLLRGHADGVIEVLVAVSPLVGWGLWMISTVIIWPNDYLMCADERPTPRCLRCGYLLTGLRSTRCPECGDEPTIDTLWRATAGTV